MRLMKKLFYICLLFIVIGQAESVYAAGDIALVINGSLVEDLPAPPTIYQGSTLVPAREVFENLGAEVDWRAAESAVYIWYEDAELIMFVNQNIALLNNVAMEMSVPPMNMNGKIFIPLRFPAECFGFKVAWDKDTSTAQIDAPLPQEPEAAPPPPAETEELPVIPLPGGSGAAETPGESTPPEVPAETPDDDPPIEVPADTSITPPVTVPSVSNTAPSTDISVSDIPRMEYPETTIVSLFTPMDTSDMSYTIVAASPITEVQKMLLEDNRLVLDIYNAICAISGPFNVSAAGPVSDVRASQFMSAPMVTRVVLDLQGAVAYSINLSPDRLALTVSFSRNTITDVRFATNGTMDTLTVSGSSTPSVSVMPLSEPDRYLITVTNADLAAPSDEAVEGAYLDRVTAWQQDDYVYIQAEASGFSAYDLVRGTNEITIRFYPNTYRNVSYNRQNRAITIPKSSGLEMDIESVTHTDDYTNRRYFLSLPVNAEEFLGYGEILVQDGYISSVIISRNAQGFTQLTVNENQVLVFSVTEDDENYYIQARRPKEMYSHIVVIDPGHGGSQPGTINNGIQEKDIDLSIALKLIQLLEENPNIKVYATRLTDMTIIPEDRPPIANPLGDLFVSIHCNAIDNGSEPNGIETYYYSHANDTSVGFTSKQLADIVQQQLIAYTNALDRGVKENEYTVLYNTTIPAVLCEVGFMSNPTEFAKILNEEYQWQLATAMYQGICQAFALYTPYR